MFILIVGAGEVGTYLARTFIDEGHDVSLLDNDEHRVRELENSFDALFVSGSAVNRDSLVQAGLLKADLVIAATQIDEVNLVACMLASKLGPENVRTIARVREIEQYRSTKLKAEDLGLSLLVGPEGSVVDQICRQLTFKGSGEIRHLADGRLVLLELPLSDDSPLVGTPLKDLNKILPPSSLIAGIYGENGFRIPHGASIVGQDERAEVVTIPENIDEYLILSGKPWHRVKQVLILGCGPLALRVAIQLEATGVYPTLIGADDSNIQLASKTLKHSIVLQGDPSDPDLLREQLSESADAVIVMVDEGEKNILLGLFAKQLGAKKIIVQSDKLAFAPLAHRMGIDAVVSPRRALTRTILQFVRSSTSTLVLGEHEGEILEMTIPNAPKNESLLTLPLRELSFPKHSLVGGILRDSKAMIPDGQTVLRGGDHVFVFAMRNAIAEIESLVR